MASISFPSYVWIHNALNLADYVRFRYINISDRVLPTQSTIQMSDGEPMVLSTPGIMETVDVTIPFPNRYDFEDFRDRLRGTNNTPGPMFYRDSRGRKFGCMVSESSADENEKSRDVRSFSIRVEVVGWTEEV
jgi:hypothetical protein